MSNEVWKDIKGYEGLYQVSNLGRVKSVSRTARVRGNGVKAVPERILKPSKTHGYMSVNLSKNGVNKGFTIHRLVAEAFIHNDSLFADTVNHKNEVRDDNRVENLEWLSNGDNTRYSCEGSKSPNAKQVRCIETGQVFGSQAEASRWLGVNRCAVSQSIYYGSRCGGYHWEYV